MFEDYGTRDGVVDETEIDSVVEQIQRRPLYSPERRWMPCEENQIQTPSPEIFGLHLDLNAYMPPTPPIRGETDFLLEWRIQDIVETFCNSVQILRVRRNTRRVRRNTTISRHWDALRTRIVQKKTTPRFQGLQELPISRHWDVLRTRIVQKRTTPQFQGLQELPAEHDLSQIPESIGTELSYSDPALKQAMAILPHSVPHVTTRTIGETEIGTPRCCSGSEIELLGKGIPSSTRPTLTDEETMKQRLQFLTESTAQHDLQSKTMRGSTLQDLKFVEAIDPCMDVSDLCLTPLQCIHRQPAIPLISDRVERGNPMRVNILNQELLLQQQSPVSARDLTGSSTCNESEGDFIARCTFQIQELQSAAGLTYGGLMTSENVGISLNNLTTSAVEAFPDHSSEFTTSETFKTRCALESWCREVGRINGFKVVVGRSDSGKLTKIERSTLLCERSGSYRAQGKNTELLQNKKLTTTATKKCECPFKLKCQMTNGSWIVQVICGEHNHQCLENLELRRKKILSSCNIPSIGGQDEVGRQMFDSSLTTNKGYPKEKNRFQPNFGEGSSQLRTLNASNVESRETLTSQTAPARMLTFSDPTQNQVVATLPHTVPHSTATQNERITGVTATYGKVKVKLPHSSLSGIVQLEEQVAKRFRLELGSFKVEYQEDEHVFLIACDEALQECVEFSSSSHNGQISLLVTNS